MKTQVHLLMMMLLIIQRLPNPRDQYLVQSAYSLLFKALNNRLLSYSFLYFERWLLHLQSYCICNLCHALDTCCHTIYPLPFPKKGNCPCVGPRLRAVQMSLFRWNVLVGYSKLELVCFTLTLRCINKAIIIDAVRPCFSQLVLSPWNLTTKRFYLIFWDLLCYRLLLTFSIVLFCCCYCFYFLWYY